MVNYQPELNSYFQVHLLYFQTRDVVPKLELTLLTSQNVEQDRNQTIMLELTILKYCNLSGILLYQFQTFQHVYSKLKPLKF